MQLWDDVNDLLKAPVAGSGKLDTVHLFLLIGLVLVITTGWILILRHIQLAVDEI